MRVSKSISRIYASKAFRDSSRVNIFSESNTFVHIWNLGSYDSRQEKEGSHVTCLLWKRISWNAEVTGVTRTLLTQYG